MGEFHLVIEGVPTVTNWYNIPELYAKMLNHHDHMRGQVYESAPGRPRDCMSYLDNCFDCTILWETAASYASKNGRNARDVVQEIVQQHIYSRPAQGWLKWWQPSSWTEEDVSWSLKCGR